MLAEIDPRSGRLTVETVRALDERLSGDLGTEMQVLAFIKEKWGARNLFFVPLKNAQAIFDRTGRFFEQIKRFKPVVNKPY